MFKKTTESFFNYFLDITNKACEVEGHTSKPKVNIPMKDLFVTPQIVSQLFVN